MREKVANYNVVKYIIKIDLLKQKLLTAIFPVSHLHTKQTNKETNKQLESQIKN